MSTAPYLHHYDSYHETDGSYNYNRKYQNDNLQLYQRANHLNHADLQEQVLPCCQKLQSANIILENRDLWIKFYSVGTEMVVTKSGRFVVLLVIYSNNSQC